MRYFTFCVVLCASCAGFAEVKPPTGPWLKPGETLVCFGDSITASKTQYMMYLTPALEAKGVKVVNAGLSGDKTPTALTRIKDVAAAGPDALMIFFGANDSLVGRGRWRDEPIVSPDAYRDNLLWIIHWFRLHTEVKKFSIVIPTGMCEGEGRGEFGDVIREYRMAAREAADRANAIPVPLDVVFTDEFNRAGADPSSLLLTADGLHYRPRGSQLAAETILKTWNMR